MRTPFNRLPALLLLLLSVLAVLPAARGDDPKQPREITNSIGMKLELIPAGEFMMGGTESAEHLVKSLRRLQAAAGLLQGRIPPASRPHHPALLSRQV